MTLMNIKIILFYKEFLYQLMQKYIIIIIYLNFYIKKCFLNLLKKNYNNIRIFLKLFNSI